MRKLLLLALLLYDIIALAIRSNAYDYDDIEGIKRPLPFLEERRNWRKKALMKQGEPEHKDWAERKHEFDNPLFLDEQESKVSSTFKNPRRYEDVDNVNNAVGGRSGELGHSAFLLNKEPEKKQMNPMNCERPHERFEACFAGCAAVTCDNPRERLRPCYPFCEPGCICVHPYVRDDRTHKCVLPDDCTGSLKGIPDLNEDI